MTDYVETITGATPNGGDRMIAIFSDAKGNPTSKAKAKRVEVIEYKRGVEIARTYAEVE
jgi:hypothetical protein